MGVIDKLPGYDESALARVEENCRRLIGSGTDRQKAEAEMVMLAIADERRRRRPAPNLGPSAAGNGLIPEKTLELIRHAAAEGRFVSYGEVAKQSGVPWNTARRAMPLHLGDLCAYAHNRGWPLLSSIVVNKENLKDGMLEPLSLAGFLKAAEALGFQINSGISFLKEQQRQVFEWARTRRSD
jgi:hypothetical protein